MEVTRIHIEGIVKGLGVNGVRETFIDTTDPIDLTKPFFAVTGVKNVSEYAWKHYCDGNYGLVEWIGRPSRTRASMSSPPRTSRSWNIGSASRRKA